MAVLELLRSQAQTLGVDEIAQQVGLHQNTVRFHLELLVGAGYALRLTEAPSRPGRPRVIYEATAAPEGEGSYRLLAEVLTEYMNSNIERPGEAAVKAGRSWAAPSRHREPHGEGGEVGSAHPVDPDEAITKIVRMLGDIGFAPELSADGTSIHLHRCPFRALAESHPDVVCGAHLGMIQGALTELGATISVPRLIPFVEPDLCIAALTRPPGHRDPVPSAIPA